MSNDQQLVTKPNIETSIKAMEEYQDLGKVESVRCERCDEAIVIEPLGTTSMKMSCSCGLYNDTLRGL
jgi:hypothetical protein